MNCCAISHRDVSPFCSHVSNTFLINISRFASLQVSKEELAKLVQGFDKQEILTSGGVTLAGQRYIYLSGTDRVIRAKLGKVGVHCMKTQQGENAKVSVFGRLDEKIFLSLLSCYRLNLRRTRSTSTSCFHSWETWRLFDYMWLLEVRRSARTPRFRRYARSKITQFNKKPEDEKFVRPRKIQAPQKKIV